jgi:hypothetical protein
VRFSPFSPWLTTGLIADVLVSVSFSSLNMSYSCRCIIFNSVVAGKIESSLPLIEQATVAELNEKHSPPGTLRKIAAIHVAVSSGQVEVVRALIEKGVNIEMETDQAERPLHHACEAGHVRIVELLIAAGADLRAKRCDAATPIDYGQHERTRRSGDEASDRRGRCQPGKK